MRQRVVIYYYSDFHLYLQDAASDSMLHDSAAHDLRYYFQ